MRPLCRGLTRNEFLEKIERLYTAMRRCALCPHSCGVDRFKTPGGICRTGYKPVVSAYHLHFGEEKVLVGSSGSGTIFFTNCNLKCVFCQNWEISQAGLGNEISVRDLADMMLELQRRGAVNINLVTPTHQIAPIVEAISIASEMGLSVPIVYNSSGYDNPEILRTLEGVIDIYMPDAKYSSDDNAMKYSKAPGYFENLKRVLKEMHRQVGDLVIVDGIAQRGLLIRHLVLPNSLAGSEKILSFIANEISENTFINIMDQYYPAHRAREFPELSRRVREEEFEEVVIMARKLGLKRVYYEPRWFF